MMPTFNTNSLRQMSHVSLSIDNLTKMDKNCVVRRSTVSNAASFMLCLKVVWHHYDWMLLHHRLPSHSSTLFGFPDNLVVNLNPWLSSLLWRKTMVKGKHNQRFYSFETQNHKLIILTNEYQWKHHFSLSPTCRHFWWRQRLFLIRCHSFICYWKNSICFSAFGGFFLFFFHTIFAQASLTDDLITQAFRKQGDDIATVQVFGFIFLQANKLFLSSGFVKGWIAMKL